MGHCFIPCPLQSATLLGSVHTRKINAGRCKVAQGSIDRRFALVLLQAYVTSLWGQIRWEHSQAGHTHIDPDVGLGGPRGGLLAEEQEVAGEQFQLCLTSLAFQDNLQEWRGEVRQLFNEATVTGWKEQSKQRATSTDSTTYLGLIMFFSKKRPAFY